ncbi:MAG: Ig-like domain-containing protein [Prevotellaceae bacterium]|nr:Ig-like domain-containing protein [Prevotellaceae bacterium]
MGVVLYSCASIGHPDGGMYDDTPPRFLSATPPPGAVGNTKTKIHIAFDEYIKLDKPGEKVIISPPQVQMPEIKANGKAVVITLNDTLKPNTTYTVDFGDAIQDNNEGNPLPDFGYSFSTGTAIDSMEVSGFVLNASNLEPVKGLQVGLYANLSDTAFTKHPFERVGRTDSRGHFIIRGIAPGTYHIFALQDADRNYYYNQPTEVIAFEDSLIVPSMEPAIRMDTIWKDTLTIDTVIPRGYTHYMPDDILLRSFKERYFSQRLLKSERLERNKFSLYFTAPADTLPLLEGLNFDATDAFVIEQPTGRIDTLHYWIRDSVVYKIDTLKMKLTYLYTDSLKQLVPRTDTLKLASRHRQKSEKELEKEREKAEKDKERRRKKGEEVDTDSITFLPVDVYCPSSMDVYDYITLSFEEPIAWYDSTAIRLEQKVDTVWREVPFTFGQDSIYLRRFNLLAQWEPDASYRFGVDSTAFHGLYGLFTNRIEQEFKIKKLDEYGQLFFNIAGQDSTAFVELVDGKDQVVRTVPVVKGHADFYFLKPGKYGARLINDTNGNGVWDTGDYANKMQPEMVYYYPQVIELKANFDLTQDWEVSLKPLDKQKPDELKKQKPDVDKKKKDRNKERDAAMRRR